MKKSAFSLLVGLLLLCAVSVGHAVTPNIDNADFEANGGFFGVAHGWSTFGDSKWEAVWDPGRVFTQGITDVPANGAGGIYQRLSVSAGARYRVEVFAKAQHPDLALAIGVDVTGGTLPGAFGTASSSGNWQSIGTEFTAIGDAATLFLRCQNPKSWPVYGWCQFDAVRIQTLTVVNLPPSAKLVADPVSGRAPLQVSLDGSQSIDPDGDSLSYHWDFGDGQTGSGATASHRYENVGIYTIALTVNDGNAGVDTDSINIEVTSEELPPNGSNKLFNGDFEQGFNQGVAQGWQTWTGVGQGYWKQSTRLGRIGSGSYGSGNPVFNAIKRLHPKIVLLEGNALGMAQAVRAELPDALIIGRLFIDHLVSLYLLNPEHYGRIHAENCINQFKPEIDVWQGMNEPFLNDVDNARRVARFEKAFSDRIQELGRKSVVFNIAVGNPGDMENMLLAEIVETLASADYVGYHAYGGVDDQLMIGPQSKWFAHRWRFYDDMYQQRGLRMPPVIYTEATTFYGWKAGHTQPGLASFQPAQIRDDLIAFERESRADPWAVGMAIFLIGSSSPQWDGWEVSNEPVIYEGAGDHNWNHPADAKSGVWSQQFGADGSPFTGGVVQRVATEPGVEYEIVTSMKLETYGPRRSVAYRVGYDQTGQVVDGNADTIVWNHDLIALEARETDIWYTARQRFNALDTRVSIWIEASQGSGFDPFRVSIDDLLLLKISP